MTFQEIQAELNRTSELAIALHLGEARVRVPSEEGVKLVKLFPNMGGVIMGCDGTLLESGKWGEKENTPQKEDVTPHEWSPAERVAWHAERVAREGEDVAPFEQPLKARGYTPAQSRGCTKTNPCEICRKNGGYKVK